MTEEDVGIVYLVQPAELVGTDRYKVGGSNKPTLDRLKAWPRPGPLTSSAGDFAGRDLRRILPTGLLCKV